MDPLPPLYQKFLAEHIEQQTRPLSLTEGLPPPYCETMPAIQSAFDDNDDDDDDMASDSDDPPPSPFKLTIHAAHSIKGSGNLIPTSPSPLADAAKFGSLLLTALQSINHAASWTNEVQDAKSRRPFVKLDLTINCGIEVVGDRNVIGNVGVRAKGPAERTTSSSSWPSTSPSPSPSLPSHMAESGNENAVVGAKRKREEDDINVDDDVKSATTQKVRCGC